MAAVEAIYLVAASLWIVVVLTAIGIGIRFLVKLRRRRRRLSRLFDVVRGPVQVGAQALRLPMLIGEVSSLRRAAFASASRRR